MKLPPKRPDDKVINRFFIAIFSITLIYFLLWGMNYTQNNQPFIFILASAFGLFMAFNIGGNDVANSFGTAVGAGTLSIPQALLVASVFEVSGAVIAGGEVTETIRNGIVNLEKLPISPLQYICVMMSALLSAAGWLLFASRRGLPVSTTHAIIGGLVGSSLILGAFLSEGFSGSASMVRWEKIGQIAFSWIISPVLGGTLSYLLFSQVKKYILEYNEIVAIKLKEIKAEKRAYKEKHKKKFAELSDAKKVEVMTAMTRDMDIYNEPDFDPADLESSYYKGLYQIDLKKNQIDAYKALHSWVPLLCAGGGMIISTMLIFKGLRNTEYGKDYLSSALMILMIGAGIWLATFVYAKTLKRKDLNKSTFLMFSWMQVFSASGFAFSHGANDIANAIGPFAAIMDIIKTNDISTRSSEIPSVVALTFGISLIVGLWFIGRRVIGTIGSDIAKIHPASGFSAELSAATVVMTASFLGLPVSSTHILVGAVLGIGLVNKDANWKMMKPIGLAWVITLPAAALLSCVIFITLHALFI